MNTERYFTYDFAKDAIFKAFERAVRRSESLWDLSSKHPGEYEDEVAEQECVVEEYYTILRTAFFYGEDSVQEMEMEIRKAERERLASK